MADRALRKYIENQTRAIHDRNAQLFLKITLLRCTEAVIKHHHIGMMHLHLKLNLFGLARTNEILGIRRFAAARDGRADFATRTGDEQMQLLHRRLKVAFAKI